MSHVLLSDALRYGFRNELDLFLASGGEPPIMIAL